MFRRRLLDDFSSVDFSSIDFDEKTKKSTRSAKDKSKGLLASFSTSGFMPAVDSDDHSPPPTTALSVGDTNREVGGQHSSGRKKNEAGDPNQKHVAVSAFGMLFNIVLVNPDGASGEEKEEPRNTICKSSGYDQRPNDSNFHDGTRAGVGRDPSLSLIHI